MFADFIMFFKKTKDLFSITSTLKKKYKFLYRKKPGNTPNANKDDLWLMARRTWQPTAVFLPGESHGQRSLAGYSPWDCKESDMTEAT